jgi:hypothetical protein
MVLSAAVAYDAAAKVAAVWQDLTRLEPKSARFDWPSAHTPIAAGTARFE